MATDESLAWQRQSIADAADALGHDLRRAGEEALRLGRPLTDAEYGAFRVDSAATVTPIKRLVYVDDHLVAI